MQFTIVLASILSVASALAITERTPVSVSGPQAGMLLRRHAPGGPVCGGDRTPLCCQLDVDGILNLSCEDAGQVHSTEHFIATCAETGRTAECCTLATGTEGLLCTEA
ncbi:hypothetical protein BS50DRAFT_629576 [Corynespora cassiicola Philippines]|uniref:Hydrophobin n=1 Tax=Corynespora cassiicola Philippines TaxID=1448308 RepID=A0A2T2P7M5_CORCC|nr:hypothetical protein BS50DRAFT_629576 [Corynespora cassiicola Philippines]